MKKTPIRDYANVRKIGLAAISLRDDDELIEVKVTNNKKDIILVTRTVSAFALKKQMCRTNRPCSDRV